MIYVLALLPVAPIACGVYLVNRALKTWVAECWKALATVIDTYQGLSALRSAHDNHVEVIERRMRGVEDAAARAEREARLVSVQLADLSQRFNGQTSLLLEVRRALPGGDHEQQVSPAGVSEPTVHGDGSVW